MAAATVPTVASAFTRQVAVTGGVPYTRAFSLSHNPHATQICRQMIRAARSFKNLNFRDYFVRRTKEKLRELSNDPGLESAGARAILAKELSDLQRQALVANLYHSPTVIIYK